VNESCGPAEDPDLLGAIREAFAAAVADNPGQVTERVADIAGWGARGIFTALCGWSAVSLQCLDRPAPGTPVTVTLGDAWTGETVGIDEAELPGEVKDALHALTPVRQR
jgi:hypothetical protein